MTGIASLHTETNVLPVQKNGMEEVQCSVTSSGALSVRFWKRSCIRTAPDLRHNLCVCVSNKDNFSSALFKNNDQYVFTTFIAVPRVTLFCTDRNIGSVVPIAININMNNWGSAVHAIGKPAVVLLTVSPSSHKGYLPFTFNPSMYMRWNSRRKGVLVILILGVCILLRVWDLDEGVFPSTQQLLSQIFTIYRADL
jgi:hypothetical protein